MLRIEAWLQQPLGATELTNEIDLIKAIRHGLPTSIIQALLDRTNLTMSEIERVVASRRTLRRRGEYLTPDESDKILRLARLYLLAEDVFGDVDKAHAWLRRPNRALENYAPLHLLDTDSGTRAVEQVLDRIAHGVYS
jgi:putative toxin-antitoxin system antitoxin component (TIGR02293 family)